jgi:hypothetical protein
MTSITEWLIEEGVSFIPTGCAKAGILCPALAPVSMLSRKS